MTTKKTLTPEQVGLMSKVSSGGKPNFRNLRAGTRHKMKPEIIKQFARYNAVAGLKKANATVKIVTDTLKDTDPQFKSFTYNKLLTQYRKAMARVDKFSKRLEALDNPNDDKSPLGDNID